MFEDVLRRILREELARHGSMHHPAPDRRLQAFLVAWHEYGGAAPWTAAEAVVESGRSRRRDLPAALAAIVGDATDPAKALGRFLQRHAGAAAGGYRLDRIKREGGVWVYAVSVES